MANKSPAQLLNELCAKSSAGLHYEIHQLTTPGTAVPIFSCKCTVTNFGGKNFSAINTGGQKVAAKQKVSLLMLRFHLKVPEDMPEPEGVVKPLVYTPQTSESSTPPGILSGSFVSDPPDILANARAKNCIGDLMTFCLNNRISCPKYLEEGSHGPSHCPVFMVSCTVGTTKQIGTTPKKQLSKAVAAYKVLVALKKSSEESWKKELVEIQTIGPEEADKIHDIVKTSNEMQKKEDGRERMRLQPKTGFVHEVNMGRNEFFDVQQKFDKMSLGPPVTELVNAKATVMNVLGKGCSPEKMRFFFKEWAATRDPDAVGIISFFEELGKELNFSVIKCAREVGTNQIHFRMNERQGRIPLDLVKFRAKADESNGEVWMVYLKTENKNPEGKKTTKSKSDVMPSAVGYGGTENEAFLNAVVDILVSFSIMFGPTAV